MAVALTAALNVSSTAQAAPAAQAQVLVVPAFDPAVYAQKGAVGLIVPGVGGTVTRADALASLERGKVVHALLGGRPKGRVIFTPGHRDLADITFYVSLPPPGTTPNHRRYPIALVGCGFHGLLTSSNTRIPGLLSIADIAPAVQHLNSGDTCDTGPLEVDDVKDAPARLRSLDRRITRMHDARGWAAVVVLVVVAALALANGGAGVRGCAAAVAASLVLSAAGVEGFWPLLIGVAVLIVGFALATLPVRLPFAVGTFLLALLLVLAIDQPLNSLAVLGARPDGGGRFYGITNQLETLLLAPTLAAAAVLGFPWLLPFAVLALVTIGSSWTGADGGGIIVYAVALGFLALRLRGTRLTVPRLGALVVGVVLVALVLVGIDAAFGGSSHVTHAVGTGPGSLFGDLGRRLHLSYLSVTSSAGKAAEFASGLAAIVLFGAFFRRGPTVEAMLVGLAASFLVNDTPVDVAFLGALGCLTLVRWESVDSRAMRRRRPVVLFASAVAVLVLAGCGKQGVVEAKPQTVVGTIKQASPSQAGAGLFNSNGCSGCHTYKPANATGKIGPDLDKLPQYAKTAKQPLAKFVQQSIVDPNAYVEKGFPKGVMPSFKTLSASDVQALVQFLTQKSG